MKSIKNNMLSILAVAFFLLLALSCKVNKIHYGAFNYNNKVEEKSDKGNYIQKNDGTKIYGSKITWETGLLTKNQIQIDDQIFKISEIKGFRFEETYFGRIRNDYIKRIVHGKVNLYVMFTEVTSTSTDINGFTRTRPYTRTDQYAQKGEDGPMIGIANLKDMIEILSDCPLAVEMLNLSNSKLRKAIKANPNYLNSVFEIYNNDCKQK